MTLLNRNGRTLVNTLRTRGFWLFGLVVILVLGIAFEIPYSYEVDFGQAQDRSFVGGMHDPQLDQGRTVRWTRQNATVRFPAVSAGEWNVVWQINGWQPNKPVTVEMRVGETVISKDLTIEWIKWQQPISTGDGDLVLELSSPTFRPSRFGSDDTRALGVRVDSVALNPIGTGLRIPPLRDYILPITGILLLCYMTTSVLRFRTREVLGFGGLGLLFFVCMIVLFREYLNGQLVQTLVLTLSAGLLFVVFGLDAVGALYRRAGIALESNTLYWLGFIVLSFFVIKVAGTFYPGIYIIDSLFHLHRLEFVQAGNLFFVTRSREFGSLETVYPPGLYLFLAPLGTFVRDGLGLLKLAMPLLEAIGGFALFAVARKGGLEPRASLFAVLLYLGAPLAFITFGWGVYTNLFAQLLLVLMLAVWFLVPWREKPVFSILVLSFLFLVGMLAHASMLLMLGVFWGIFLVLSWFLQRDAQRRAVLTGLALGLAALVAFGLYFSNFLEFTLANLGSLQERASSTNGAFERTVGGGLADTNLGLVPLRVRSAEEWLVTSAVYLARETWVYYRSIPIVLAVLGLIGLWRSGRRDLTLILGAGFLTVLVFFLVGMVFNLYTRYMLFGALFFALGAGYLMDVLAKRGVSGRLLVVGIILLILVSSLGFWGLRVIG